MTFIRKGAFLLAGGLLFVISGCATLEVTERKTLVPATEKQSVTLGIQATGDMLQDVLNDPETGLVKAAAGQLFDKVTLLPKESRFMQPQAMQSAYGVDYILALGISDISVNGELNPYWFVSFPILFFKIYTPIVTFQPGISIDASLSDARTGSLLMQKQIMETGSDHFAPSNPGPKVRKLVSLTTGNALVTILRDTQQSIAAARKAGR